MRIKGMGKLAAAASLAVAMMAAPVAIQAQAGGAMVLKPANLQKLLPASVYYHGQSATTQLRNSGGVKFADGYYVLAALVDTSGYSTDVASKYQAYFITEVPLKVGGEDLPAGVYGAGFIANHKFVVTDVGGHDVLTVPSSYDTVIKRPRPLQVMANPGGGYRLYYGRKYVVFSRR
jgi:hypothetical protein